MPTLEEIKLTPKQEAMMLALIEDMATAPNELKQLVRMQKHIKLIWEAAQAEVAPKEGQKNE